MSKQKRPGLNIQVYFVLLSLGEILITVAGSGVVAWVLGRSWGVSVFHPVVWLILFSLVIGLGMALAVNHLFLRPLLNLGKAMRKVADGDFSVEMPTGGRLREVASINSDFNLMVRALRSTETLQADFISNVSHEFKTPINAIEGYTTLLQDSATPEQEAYVQRILMNTGRLSTLVGNILLLSKADNHAIEAAATSFRLDEQIRQCVLLLEPQWADKDIDFDIELDEITWTGNETLLQHVWTNLISNAVKFDPDGGLVRLRLYRGEGQLKFTCEDSGPGIPPEEQEKVFRRFYQSDSSHKQEGNGLGLALCRQILNNIPGAEISVTNREEGGCRFTVVLPE